MAAVHDLGSFIFQRAVDGGFACVDVGHDSQIYSFKYVDKVVFNGMRSTASNSLSPISSFWFCGPNMKDGMPIHGMVKSLEEVALQSFKVDGEYLMPLSSPVISFWHYSEETSPQL